MITSLCLAMPNTSGKALRLSIQMLSLRMAAYRYHIAPERDSPLPDEGTLPVVEADEPLDAWATAGKLAREGALPNQPGMSLWVRFVVGHNNGRIQVACVPLTVEATIPGDWR